MNFQVYFFIISFFLTFVSIYMILLYLNIQEKDSKKRHSHEDIFRKFGKYPKVIFIVPAYNEEDKIEKTIKSIMEVEYPKNKFKVIAVDDGSKDKTYEILLNLKKRYKNLVVLRKKNGGKASALNFGLKYAIKNEKFDFFAIIDADTIIPKNYLTILIKFENEKVIGVSSKVLPIETRSFAQKLQILEYAISNFTKYIYSYYDSWMIANTGTIFKKEALEKIGFFDESEITEDLEYGMRVVEKSYKIDYAPWIEVRTEIPKTLLKVLKQRIRWHYGWFINTLKHRKVISSLSTIITLSFAFFFYNLIAFLALIANVALHFLKKYYTLKYSIDIGYSLFKFCSLDFLFSSILSLSTNHIFWASIFTLLLTILYNLTSAYHNKIKINVIITYFYLSFYWIILGLSELISLINVAAKRKKWWR